MGNIPTRKGRRPLKFQTNGQLPLVETKTDELLLIQEGWHWFDSDAEMYEFYGLELPRRNNETE